MTLGARSGRSATRCPSLSACSNSPTFFFSRRRRHTRYIGDWSSDRVLFRSQGGSGGQLPIGLVYSDMARRGRFAVSCAPGYDGRMGGRDAWALELAGRAEAASGLADSMAWADNGSEVFVISQIGYTRDIIAKMRERLGPQALAEEDKMLVDAQMNLGLKVGTEAAHSFMNGGISGLMNFGKQQAVSNATTAVAYNVDKTFHVRVRTSVQMSYMGSPGT